MQNPALTHNAAFIASSLAECSGAFSPEGEEVLLEENFWAAAHKLSLQIHDDTLTRWQAEGVLMPSSQLIENKLHTQRAWTDKINEKVKKDLFDNASLRDKVRLQAEWIKAFWGMDQRGPQRESRATLWQRRVSVAT